MGRIIAEAGGAISNGKKDILSILPDAIDNITPVYAGSKKEIGLIERCTKKIIGYK